MNEFTHRWAADALDSPRGNLGACMWIRREMGRQMEGLVAEGQRLVQYGGSIDTFDLALVHLNARADVMRSRILAAIELRKVRESGTDSTAQAIYQGPATHGTRAKPLK